MRHIFNRVYVTTDQLQVRDRKGLRDLNIGLVLMDEPANGFPSDEGIIFEKVKLPQNRDGFIALSTRMQTIIDAGQGVLIYAQDERDPLFLVVMAYLMDTVGMSFPNAYTRIVMAYAMLNVDVSPLIAVYGLPFEQSAELHGNLIALSRTAISPIDDQIFISGIEALENPAKARAVGIDAVLRLDRGSNRADLQWADRYRLLDIPIHDGTLVSSELLRQGAAFIHRHINAGDKVFGALYDGRESVSKFCPRVFGGIRWDVLGGCLCLGGEGATDCPTASGLAAIGGANLHVGSRGCLGL